MDLNIEKIIEGERTEKEERNRKSIDSLNSMSAEAVDRKQYWNDQLGKALMEEKEREAEMQAEIAQIQAEADQRIQAVRDRYAGKYGQKTWNTSSDAVYKNFVNSLVNKDR